MGDAMKADGAFIGQDVSVTPLIGKLRLHIQGYEDKEDFFISPLKHEDVILGAPWFDCLSASIKFPERRISFKFREKDMWISCKKINPEIIVRARDNAIETVCLLEEHFPTSILNIQVHLLVHLVDEVEIAGTMHARWMFFLERFMKTLKGFVRQRARPEGSMAEGWLVQESCVFVSEYLSRSQNNALELWSMKDDDRVVGDVPQGNGVVKRFSEEVRTKVSNYCMMNIDGMQKWYELYEKTRQEQIQAREEWNQANRGVPYPEWLRLLPKSMSASWLQGKIASAKASGELISLDEQEYAFGPDWHSLTYTQFRMRPCGVNLPHTHPRASKMLTLVNGGALQVDFVDTEGVRHIDILYPGDITIFPRDLLHFELNVGKQTALYISALNSQNTGVLTAAGALLNIPLRALARSFNRTIPEVETLQENKLVYGSTLEMPPAGVCTPAKILPPTFEISYCIHFSKLI
ncbi:hypothetical protein L7F22_026149 [Adiantum nelumboides]|nr:hypothetical protein [Adiantum nelumboides]